MKKTRTNNKVHHENKKTTDGTYTEQKPDEIDTVNGWLMLKINHFSRYAVAWSN